MSETENLDKEIKNSGTGIKILAAAIIAISLALGYMYFKDQQKRNYYKNCANAYNYMLKGGVVAEDTCNIILDIWHNSIWQISDDETDIYTKDSSGNFYDDFNDALNQYESSLTYLNSIDDLKEYTDEAKRYMQTLRTGKTPSEYLYLYNGLEEMYEKYVSFTNMPIYISGSYLTFSEEFSSRDKDFYNQLLIVKAYFE